MKSIPRPEHPRPSFYRETWRSLNGVWEFYNDVAASGRDRELYQAERFDGTIVVPFCPESALSGVGNTEFMPSVWYARTVPITGSDLDGRVLLHFGAVDYETTVYVNGTVAGTHRGGYTSFTFDITDKLTAGDNRLVVHARDELRSGRQPCGKQSRLYYSHDCDYTRTTGIWQTVWLEFVPETYIRSVKITATDLSGAVQLETELNRYAADAALHVAVSYKGQPAGEYTFPLDGVVTRQSFTVSPVHLWGAGDPNLYDVSFTLLTGGNRADSVRSYFGIRRVDIDGYRVLLNGKPLFQRLVLDQGFYPDGIYTAPTDEALRQDIELAMALGYNGARMHQKVFEERYIYHADRLGYILWGEFADWGLDVTAPDALHIMLPEWMESVARDYSRPSVIGWCPHNETWDQHHCRQIDTNISLIYAATKALDPTRPVIDTSGFFHTADTDIYDVHDYCQNPAEYADRYARHAQGDFFDTFVDRQRYDGQRPYFVSEMGGIKWQKENDSVHDARQSWGYGDAPQTQEDFCERYCGLIKVLLATPNIMGLCYTQLTDVEQEQNGLYYYDRSAKFPQKIYDAMRAALQTKAAIEEE